ncbi:MAG TPA: protein lplB [Ruminiclostridium sp.]|jgi:putative aldouronate transport system permease protein|nr:sugar ABC transporter permease [Clostridiaceae bacterium]HAA25514.1 protein lplB [Ruminiclostridium sp.]
MTVLNENIRAKTSLNRKDTIWKKIVKQRQLLVLSVPFMIFVLVFNYLPIWGWIMAFQKFVPGKGIFGSEFVGLANFKEAFTDSNFINAIRNTLLTSILKISTSFVSAILLALMLNEVRARLFKRIVQTISYLPYFISWVVAVSIVYMVLSPSSGIVNEILVALGLIKTPIAFLGEGKYFYGVVALSNVWKNVGWNAIIYLAAMTGIDPEIYESAIMDGAGRIRRIISVTLPSIMPTIKLMLILNLGNLMNVGFEQVYLLSNPSNIDASRTIDVYIYTYALRSGRLSYGTAIGIFNSTVAITLINICNYISKKIDGYGIF